MRSPRYISSVSGDNGSCEAVDLRIVRVDIGYDRPGLSGGCHGFIDDLTVGH